MTYMDITKKKKAVAGLSILSNVFLSVLKIAVGIISGSISVISEAIHSMSDCVASFITLFSVIKSSKPADIDHPFGHGRYEDMSGFIEGLLIVFASFYIIYEATKKIILNTHIETQNNLGIIVMLIAVIMNVIVSMLLFKVARESNSISLYADGEHLRTDIYSSFGVLLGLILIKVTGYSVLDPIVAILVAMFIYKTGYSISKKAWMNLLDHSLPDEDIEKIKNIIGKYSENVTLKPDSIKARKTGPTDDIDFVLQFKHDTSICECHKICDEIEAKIGQVFLNSTISIHLEPVCYCKTCMEKCSKLTCN